MHDKADADARTQAGVRRVKRVKRVKRLRRVGRTCSNRYFTVLRASLANHVLHPETTFFK